MEARNERQILRDMLSKAEDKELIQTSTELINAIENGERTENQYVLDLATHAYIFAQYEGYLKAGYDNLYVNTAVGESLDRLGLLLNVTRYPATPATVTVEVEMEISTGTDTVIPKGTVVVTSNQGGVYTDYVTSEAVTILANTTTATVQAECVDLGYGPVLDVGAVQGLVIDPSTTISATNTERGTPGRDIEEDDHYRQRILNWASATQIGSKTYIENYLYNYDGITSFNLIPQFNGIGTLKIVVDAPSNLLDTISNDVYENCMLISDVPPTVIRPTYVDMEYLYVYLKNADADQTHYELDTMVMAQIKVYVDGGTTRSGHSYSGLAVGESFEPSKCVQFLLSEFPELSNIYFSDMSTVDCEAGEHLKSGGMTALWED